MSYLEINDVKYFNGETSFPHRATLHIDEQNKMHFIHYGDRPMVWVLTDVKFNQYGQTVELRNPRYPAQLITFQNEFYARQLYKILKRVGTVGIYQRLVNISMTKVMLHAALLIASLIGAYWFLLPPLAERAAVLLPQKVDIELGKLAEQNTIRKSSIDHRRSRLLYQFAAQLQLNNSIPLKFSVVNSKDINAFALPNGHIVVYNALLNELNTYEELAALIGHEVAHVNQRHSIKQLSKSLAGYLVISLLVSDMSSLMAILAENANQLQNLSYSRKHEREADEEGLKLLIINQIDPNGMVRLFEILESHTTGELPEFLSTHPVTGNRKKHIRKYIEKSSFTTREHRELQQLFRQLQSSGRKKSSTKEASIPISSSGN